MLRSKSTETLSFSEDMFKLLHCCSGDEIHYAKDALILPCKHHICRNCVENAYKKEVRCNFENCNQKHNVDKVQLLAPNPLVDLVIKEYGSELTLRMREDLEKKISYIKGDTI